MNLFHVKHFGLCIYWVGVFHVKHSDFCAWASFESSYFLIKISHKLLQFRESCAII